MWFGWNGQYFFFRQGHLAKHSYWNAKMPFLSLVHPSLLMVTIHFICFLWVHRWLSRLIWAWNSLWLDRLGRIQISVVPQGCSWDLHCRLFNIAQTLLLLSQRPTSSWTFLLQADQSWTRGSNFSGWNWSSSRSLSGSLWALSGTTLYLPFFSLPKKTCIGSLMQGILT